MRLLIANRGEIARRIIRTTRRLGFETVAVYADPDRGAPHVHEADAAVHIGPASLAESYLNIERLLRAARETGATAIHPGYGFLAENASFARAVVAEGLVWVGPKPDVLELMGSKIEAARIASQADVPVIPRYSDSQDPEALAAAAEEIGYPVLIKAAAGGGGKGIRLVRSVDEFESSLAEAKAEGQRSFGDDSVMVERFIASARHIEVQLIGDRFGALAELGTRECSIQRRYQKLLEEAPAPNLASSTRRGLRQSAMRLGRAIGYDSAGTVEFVVDDRSGEHYFLEMNTRLQVEHGITEAVTGVDLVELMLRVAHDEPLPLAPGSLRISGHAIQARILAEDAAQGFAPQTGVVTDLVVPDDVRFDAAVVAGTEISTHYDSMIAKLICTGQDRPHALRGLRRALDGLIVGGLVTTAGFHRWLIDQPEVIEGRVDTSSLERLDYASHAQTDVELISVAAARTWHFVTQRATSTAHPWTALHNFSLTPRIPLRPLGVQGFDGAPVEIVDEFSESADPFQIGACSVDVASRRVSINIAGHTHTVQMPTRTQRWARITKSKAVSESAVLAPFPAVVDQVLVVAGDEVEPNQPLIVIEAMKMLHTLRSSGSGRVANVKVSVGAQVASRQILVEFVTEKDSP